MNKGIYEALFPMDLSLVFFPFTSFLMIPSVPPISPKTLPQTVSTVASHLSKYSPLQVTVLQEAVYVVARAVLHVC